MPNLIRLVIATAIGLSACNARPAPPATSTATDTTRPPAGRLAFAITSPHAGDTLIEGQTYTIRWMAPDSFQINMGVAMGGKDKGMVLTDVPATPDSLIWTVPVGFVTGFGPASSDQIRLRMENARNPDQWTESGPFTIMGKLGAR